MRISLLATLAAALVATNSAAAEVATELERLAADYARDPKRADVTFGVRVDGSDWTLSSRADGVDVGKGAPDGPAMIFVTDAATFARIARGDLHSLTAMAQARSSDPIPLDIELINGLELDRETRRTFLSVLFHFFVTGQPEIVTLASKHSRVVHGGNALPIYYAPQVRTSWYEIAKGQHINKDPRDQVNDFDSLFIFIKAGTARARLGGKEVELRGNTAIFVPEGMAHEFWNDGEAGAEFILVMFGEGA